MVWMGWMGWIGWAGWVHRQDRARPRDGTNGIIVRLKIQWAVAVGLFGGGGLCFHGFRCCVGS